MPPLALLARQTGKRVGLAQRGDVLGPAIDDGQAIQVAAIFGGQALTKGGRQRGKKL